MSEADVETVFQTKRGTLAREVLLEAGLALLVWAVFLRGASTSYDGAFLTGGCLVGALATAARARDLVRWPQRRPWSGLAALGVTVAVIVGLRIAPAGTAWTVVGFSSGAVATRILLYVTGAWRPETPP